MPKQLPLNDADWRKILKTLKEFGPDFEEEMAKWAYRHHLRQAQALIERYFPEDGAKKGEAT
jgi:hypothetical protein